MFGIGHEAAFSERRVNALAIGEEQRVADVEEDDFDFRVHGLYSSIISLAAGSGGSI